MQQGNIEPTTIVLDTATKTMSSRTYEATSVISKGIAQNVSCSGLGLKRGFVGKENQFFVDASKAGQFLPFVNDCCKKHATLNLRNNKSHNYLICVFIYPCFRKCNALGWHDGSGASMRAF